MKNPGNINDRMKFPIKLRHITFYTKHSLYMFFMLRISRMGEPWGTFRINLVLKFKIQIITAGTHFWNIYKIVRVQQSYCAIADPLWIVKYKLQTARPGKVPFSQNTHFYRKFISGRMRKKQHKLSLVKICTLLLVHQLLFDNRQKDISMKIQTHQLEICITSVHSRHMHLSSQ